MSTTTAVKEGPSNKVVTGMVRFSYANVWEPTAMREGQDKKYSVALLIDKKDKDTLSKINAIITRLTAEAKAKFGKLPKDFNIPLRDGDTDKEDDEAGVYAGHYFINAKSKDKPGIVDKDLNKIIDKDEFYSGCYGRASINFFIFDTAGNKGIGCGLNNLQKLKDGETLGGRSRAEDDFSEVAEDDDLLD